jgi:hypothetical protein
MAKLPKRQIAKQMNPPLNTPFGNLALWQFGHLADPEGGL